jgi:carbon-monoxide dehydrogenase small subunit
MKIDFVLNEEEVSVDVEHSKRLLDVLREDLHQISVKEGCGEGECGSCSVLMDGRLVNSCLIAMANVEGCHITTLEGFCTPGFVLAAEALLSENPDPSAAEVMKGIEGNLCRCTGYHMIVAGILEAKEIGKGLW